MNLHAIAGPIIATVNPMTLATVRYSAGYTTGAGARQVPVYDDVEGVRIQVQALSGKDLAHVTAQNVQGVVRAVYMFGDTQGVVRPLAKGGDLLLFEGKTWLVVTVFETWPGWCKVGVTLQEEPAL